MAPDKAYLTFILEQLSGLSGISCRAMMGEYILYYNLYYNGKVAAFLCDDRLLVKSLPSTTAMLPTAPHEPPYAGARNMLLVEDVDDQAFLEALFRAMEPELPTAKARKRKLPAI